MRACRLILTFCALFTAPALLAQSDISEMVFGDSFERCRDIGEILPGSGIWDGGGDGVSWFDPLNWQGDEIPVNGERVIIRLDDRDGTVEFANTGVPLQLAYLDICESLSLTSGNLVVSGDVFVRGNLALSGSNTVLELQGSSSISGNVTITDSADLTANGDVGVTGTLQQGGGASDGINATVGGTGTLTVTGLYTWTAGLQAGTGETTATSGIEMSGSGPRQVFERTVNFNAASSWSGGNTAVRDGATLNFNAPFDIQTDDDMPGLGETSTVNIASTFTKSAGSDVTRIDAAFNNSGTVNVDAGELQLGRSLATGVSSGIFNVAAGSIIGVNGGHDMTGASRFLGAGGYRQLGENVDNPTVIGGAYSLAGPLFVGGGRVQFNSPELITDDVSITNGTAEFLGATTVSGNAMISGNTGALIFQDASTISGDVTVSDSGKLTTNGDVGVTGTLQQGGGASDGINATVDGTGTLTVTGLYTWTAGEQLGTGVTTANNSIEMSSGGQRNIDQRTINFNAASSWSGGNTTVRDGATLNFNAPFDIQTDDDMPGQGATSTLNIASTFTKSAGSDITSIDADVNNAGTVSVTAGDIQFDRGFTQTADGQLDVRVTASGADLFAVSDATTLDGTLDIILDGVEPGAGETFTVMTFPSVTGTFTTVNGTAIPNDKEFTIDYNSGTSVVLEVFDLCRDIGEILPGSKLWDGGGDGVSWFDPLNWEGDEIPVNGDRVIIRLDDRDGTVEFANPGNSLQLAYLDICESLSLTSGNLVVSGDAFAGGNLMLSGGSTVLELQGSSSISGNVTITDSADLIANGDVGIAGTLTQGGGLSGGFNTRVDGTGTLTVTGLYTWAAGNQLGTGVTTANSGIVMSGSGPRQVFDRTVNFNAASSWSGGTTTVRNGATLNFNAPFDIQTDDDMGAFGAVSTINIASTFTKSAGSDITSIAANFNNTGTINVDAGELQLGVNSVGGVSSGTFNVAAGSILGVRGIHDMTGASQFLGAGGYRQAGGASTPTVINGTYSLTGPLIVNGGKVQFVNPESITDDVTITNGELEFLGATTVSGDATIGGTQGVLTFQAASTISGNVTITDSADLIANGDLGIAGTLTQGGGNSGGFQTKVDGTGTLTVTGLYTWTAGEQLGTGVTTANSGIVMSSGSTRNIAQRTINFNAASSWSSGITTLRVGATLNFNAPFDIQTDDDMLGLGATSTLNIASTFTKSAGSDVTSIDADVNNAGTVSVTAGDILFDRGFSQTADGQLNVRVTASGADLFAVSDATTLDGTLDIILDGVEPGVGETFTIMTFPSATGTFATVNGTAIPNDKAFTVDYSSGTSVMLEVVAVPP